MKAIRIRKNNMGNSNNNKKIGIFVISICLFMVVIVGLVLGLGLKTKNVNSDNPHVGKNNLIEIKNTNSTNYYNNSDTPFFIFNIVDMMEDYWYVRNDFNFSNFNVYMNEFSILQTSIKKSFYLNENDARNKTNEKTVIYKYEFFVQNSNTEYFYMNDFFVNGVEYK